MPYHTTSPMLIINHMELVRLKLKFYNLRYYEESDNKSYVPLPYDLSYVGGDEVSDELFHVVVDSTAFLYRGHNGGEVIVSQHHLYGSVKDSIIITTFCIR